MFPEDTRACECPAPPPSQFEELAQDVERMLMRIAEGWRATTAARMAIAQVNHVSEQAARAFASRPL